MRQSVLIDASDGSSWPSVEARLTLRRLGFREAQDKPRLFFHSLRDGEAAFVDFRLSPRGEEESEVEPQEAVQAPRFYTTLDRGGRFWDASEGALDEIAYLYWWLEQSTLPNTRCMIRLGSSSACLQIRTEPRHPEERKNPARCRACGKWEEDSSKRHTHHIQYEPEVTIPLCNACHAKVHHSDDPAYEYLRPDQDRPTEQPAYTLEECRGYMGTCRGGGRMQVPTDEDSEKTLCSRCQREKERRTKQRAKRGSRSYSDIRKPHWQPGDSMP